MLRQEQSVTENLQPAAELSGQEFERIAAIMQADARIHLPRQKVTLVQSRLARRMRHLRLSSWRAYLDHVEGDAAERRALVIALTTNHTHFFREKHHFDDLAARVVPQLAAVAGRREPVRIWSAGCSSGEEVYSIAMTLLGGEKGGPAWMRGADVRLLATDISDPVVERARAAVYAEAAVEPVPPALRTLWTRPHGEGQVVIADQARALVTAKVLNLFHEWPMQLKFDVIFCRNVMIYFDEPAKAELTRRFAAALKPGGTLYIGHSERLVGPDAGLFRPGGQTIYHLTGDPT